MDSEAGKREESFCRSNLGVLLSAFEFDIRDIGQKGRPIDMGIEVVGNIPRYVEAVNSRILENCNGEWGHDNFGRALRVYLRALELFEGTDYEGDIGRGLKEFVRLGYQAGCYGE